MNIYLIYFYGSADAGYPGEPTFWEARFEDLEGARATAEKLAARSWCDDTGGRIQIELRTFTSSSDPDNPFFSDKRVARAQRQGKGEAWVWTPIPLAVSDDPLMDSSKGWTARSEKLL